MPWRSRPACLALALLCCGLPASGIGAQTRHGTKQDTAILALRHYALSSCLRQAFPSLADEADAAKDGFGAQFGLWTRSPSPRCFQRTRWEVGMPSLVIRFSTAQATLASVLWAGSVRARRLLPMTAL